MSGDCGMVVHGGDKGGTNRAERGDGDGKGMMDVALAEANREHCGQCSQSGDVQSMIGRKPERDELSEKLALQDFEHGAGADTLNGAYETVSDGLDKLERAGYDVSEVRELAKEAHQDENKEALRTIADSMASEIRSGSIEKRLPGGDASGGGADGHVERDELSEKLALQDFEHGAGADTLDGAYETVSDGLDKLERAGYDVSEVRELAKEAHQDENKAALRTIADSMASEIRSGSIENRLPGGDVSGDGAGGHVERDELSEKLALQDFEHGAGADTLDGAYETVSDGLDKLERAGYDVSEVRELAKEAHQDENKEALRTIADSMASEIRSGSIENRLPENDMAGGHFHHCAVNIPGVDTMIDPSTVTGPNATCYDPDMELYS